MRQSRPYLLPLNLSLNLAILKMRIAFFLDQLLTFCGFLFMIYFQLNPYDIYQTLIFSGLKFSKCKNKQRFKNLQI